MTRSEAMTLGHRVAVLQAGDGEAPVQLGSRWLLRRSCSTIRTNLFVAGFIGSPGDEHGVWSTLRARSR